MKNGISVVICCYNSAARLEPTLVHLSRQNFSRTNDWELIVIDNACTDNTAEIAEAIWKKNHSAVPLKIIIEKKPGLSYARQTGLRNSFFEYVLFCDDDNWLSENYLSHAYSLIEADSSIAAVGGKGIAEFEDGNQPNWFLEYQEAYAVGSQMIGAENNKLLSLYGAGLLIRKSYVNSLFRNGFRPLMRDRTGKSLFSSGDTELTNALVLAGYKLCYSEEMSFKHFLPKTRINKEYLTRLFIAFGNDGPIRNLYYSFLTDRTSIRLIKYWWIHFALAGYRLVKYFVKPPKTNGRIIYLKWNIAYIRQLLILYPEYTAIRFRIAILQKRFTNLESKINPSLLKTVSETPTFW